MSTAGCIYNRKVERHPGVGHVPPSLVVVKYKFIIIHMYVVLSKLLTRMGASVIVHLLGGGWRGVCFFTPFTPFDKRTP